MDAIAASLQRIELGLAVFKAQPTRKAMSAASKSDVAAASYSFTCVCRAFDGPSASQPEPFEWSPPYMDVALGEAAATPALIAWLGSHLRRTDVRIVDARAWDMVLSLSRDGTGATREAPLIMKGHPDLILTNRAASS